MSEPQRCGSFSFRAAKTKRALRPRSCSFATMPELPDRYDPSITEPAVYAQWLGAECFAADATRSSRIGGDRVPFTIVMPPPNVTGILHVGHGLTYTVQDVLIRWARMRRTALGQGGSGDQQPQDPNCALMRVAPTRCLEHCGSQTAAEAKGRSGIITE